MLQSTDQKRVCNNEVSRLDAQIFLGRENRLNIVHGCGVGTWGIRWKERGDKGREYLERQLELWDTRESCRNLMQRKLPEIY